MRLRVIVAALAICGSLAGCDGCGTPDSIKTTATRTETPQDASITIHVEVVWKPAACRLHGASGTGLDVSNISIDMTGQGTTVLDGAGSGTLMLTHDGTVIGLTTFNYVVMDAMAVVADPAAVNAWLSHYPSANGYSVELHDIGTTDTAPGTASLSVDTLYGNDVISTGGTSWASNAGSGCVGNPGGNPGSPFPEQPIELPGEGGCP